ncbi:MAG: hypothetical protein IPK17_13130 [Chloroflexi bacterium]|uniref:hypothetical protein n=1 Tax=Candidatus Flexifilum breve TaxID=3140694 RepID=UPI003136BDE6|nr:hypothetical protein [Chloroflexota bacterium]
MSSKPPTPKPIMITLTLPDTDSENKTGRLLVQRGDLARVHQFTYERVADLTEVIADALIAFAAVEADPPIIPDLTPPKPQSRKQAEQPAPPSEPTVDIPLKKGKKAVKISHLKITGRETDAAAYRQAVLIAGKLIDGKLWDGESPIRIDDVYALAKKMKHLTERDLSLFALTDFVQTGDPTESDDTSLIDEVDDEDALTLEAPQHPVISSNGHHGTNGATEQSALL